MLFRSHYQNKNENSGRNGDYKNRTNKPKRRNTEIAPKVIKPAEETLADIKADNDRIEKEIWIDIAEIHTIKLE